MRYIVFLLSLLFHFEALAQTELLIKGGSDNAVTIEILDFSSDSVANAPLIEKMHYRVKKQLEETQIFKVHDKKLSTKSKLLAFRSFSGAKDFVSSDISVNIISDPDEEELLSASISIYDRIYDQTDKSEFSFEAKDWSRAAAKISDIIYQKHSGLSGYINTQLLFISESGSLTKRKKRIALMDFYGDNLEYITNSKNLVLSPRLSPDRKKAIYISYASGIPALYMVDLKKMRSKRLLKFKGMIYAPRFSPDGKDIVLAASYNGNSEIAIFNLKKKKLKRITRNYAIDTSPAFSPDGKKIVFSSDRDGGQKLYIMDRNGKNLQKVASSAGNYANPVWSPDGKYIAFTKIHHNKFHIGTLNLENMDIKILTTSYKDESPSWAPNSKYIIFNRRKPSSRFKTKNISELYLINLNGLIIKKIKTPEDASEPDWVTIF